MTDIFSDPIVPDPKSPISNSPAIKSTLQIEVVLKESAKCRIDATQRYIEQYIRDNYTSLSKGTIIAQFDDYVPVLKHNVDCIRVVDVEGLHAEIVRLESATLEIHVFHLRDQTTHIADHDDGNTEGQAAYAKVTELPGKSLDGMWDSLVFDTDVKESLLHYISSVMLFTDKEVNSQLVTFQRLVLLHGPPGSGKTSLCRSLAQKIAIRLSGRYSHCRLVEINATSLFSRYFSESSKLVAALFEKIYNMTQDHDNFVCVVIDEIESLTTSRTTTMGSEPSDSMRVVNVLLTQLDRLKESSNLLVLTTTNMLHASDPAFIDRADVVKYVGIPGSAAVYQILRSCLLELMRARIVEQSQALHPFEQASVSRWSQRLSMSSRLLEVSETCSKIGLSKKKSSLIGGPKGIAEVAQHLSGSGRFLRRMPLIAHYQYIRQSDPCTLDEMLSALSLVVSTQAATS